MNWFTATLLTFVSAALGLSGLVGACKTVAVALTAPT